MKTRSLSFSAFFVLVFTTLFITGCGEDPVTFDLKFENLAPRVPALGLPYNEFKIFTDTVLTTGIEATLNQYDLSLNDITEATLQNLSVAISSPSGRNFDNVLFLEAYGFSSPTDSIKIAYTETIPPGATSIVMLSQFSNLAPLIQQDQFQFIVRGFITGDYPTESILDVDLVVRITGEK